ncbi:MAG: hypothetical protein ACLFR2_04585 [Candidatus Kapaibacterium sp.]
MKRIIGAFLVLAFLGSAILVNTVFSYTDIAAGPGKIWVGAVDYQDGSYVDHNFIDGGMSIICNPGGGCCWEIINDGRHLRLYDAMPQPPRVTAFECIVSEED